MSCDNSTAYIANSARGQDEANPECCLATWIDKIGPFYPLGISHFNTAPSPQKKKKNWELVQLSN